MLALLLCLPLPGCGKNMETTGILDGIEHMFSDIINDRNAAYPMPLPEFLAAQHGKGSFDLTKATSLGLRINHCEYGEPEYTSADPATVLAAADAFSAIELTGNHDNVSSTGTHYIFVFYDAAGECICSAAFQDGMLMTVRGRYPVDGLDALFAAADVLMQQAD